MIPENLPLLGPCLMERLYGMKIGIHGLFKRCVLLRNCKLGKSLMPCLSYLKFPSFTDKKGVCRPGSKNSVARWIVSLIKWVYQDTSKHLSTVRAHDTRKLATSWALFNGASITEIIRAFAMPYMDKVTNL
jgi:hypothetical protein